VVVVACYVVGAVLLNVVVVHRLISQADARIGDQLADAGRFGYQIPAAATSSREGRDGDLDDAPIFFWSVGPSGRVDALTAGAPTLPRRSWGTEPVTITIGGTEFRLEARRSGRNWLVAGQNVTEIVRVQSALLLPELIFGAVLFVATFSGALVVGLRASAPLDLVRRRQAEFTADASHELRTPLSVIEAEVDLALRRHRDPEEYRAVLHRVGKEASRLDRIVEDLLWLARADSGPVETQLSDTADVVQIVAACTDRFRAVADRAGVVLEYQGPDEEACISHAKPDWIDRLAGVLIDNACKFAGAGGRVEVRVRVSGNRVGLMVDDSGPGIPPEERTAVFDRFHRATAEPGGVGLGLAIADSVVRMTQGDWSVSSAPLGGARMAVWWRRSAPRHGPPVTSEGLGAESNVVGAAVERPPAANVGADDPEIRI
jgi:signal transduction histidine kinase